MQAPACKFKVTTNQFLTWVMRQYFAAYLYECPALYPGRRACLGETLARMELFLFLTGLLQKFEFRAVQPDQLPTVDNTTLGLTLIPDQHIIKAVKVA